MARSSTAVVLAVLAAACSREVVESSWQMGDTTFVYSSEPEHESGSLREVFRIGAVEGPPEYLFDRISMIAVGPDGHVFVAQIGGELREYDARGGFVRTIAGVGQGPGEVDYVVGMDVAEDGRLAVVDFGNQRISVYSAEGAFLRQIRRPPGRPGYGRDAIRWDTAGQLWIAIHPPRSGPDTLQVRRPLYGRVIADAEVADTLYLPARAWQGCERRRPGYAGGFFEDARIPYMPFAQWTRSRSGALVFGCSASYSIEVVHPSGEVTRLSRQWEPPVMTEEEQEFYSLVQEINTGISRPRFSVPRERPAFLRLWSADDGRIWLWPGSAGTSEEVTAEERASFSELFPGRSVPSRFWSYWSPTDGLDVFDADGEWLGHVDTPESWEADPYPGTADPLFRGDTIWAVTTDELGVSYVSKFVVQWVSSP